MVRNIFAIHSNTKSVLIEVSLEEAMRLIAENGMTCEERVAEQHMGYYVAEKGNLTVEVWLGVSDTPITTVV